MSREPNVTDAFERAYEAARSLLARCVDLLAPKTGLLLCDGRMLGIGILVAFSGWLFLMLGLIDGLAERYPRLAVELAVGLAHGVAAALLIMRGGRRAPRRETEAVRLRLVSREPQPQQARELVASARTQARRPKVEEPQPPGESAVDWMLANASAALLGATALAMLLARLVTSRR